VKQREREREKERRLQGGTDRLREEKRERE